MTVNPLAADAHCGRDWARCRNHEDCPDKAAIHADLEVGEACYICDAVAPTATVEVA